jgi:hypothetical protein
MDHPCHFVQYPGFSTSSRPGNGQILDCRGGASEKAERTGKALLQAGAPLAKLIAGRLAGAWMVSLAPGELRITGVGDCQSAARDSSGCPGFALQTFHSGTESLFWTVPAGRAQKEASGPEKRKRPAGTLA